VTTCRIPPVGVALGIALVDGVALGTGSIEGDAVETGVAGAQPPKMSTIAPTATASLSVRILRRIVVISFPY
jgi:hypothetical protein